MVYKRVCTAQTLKIKGLCVAQEGGAVADLNESRNTPPRLGEMPNWRYLLREFYDLYRYSSAGGSQRIRTHQKEVRHRLSRLMKLDPHLELPTPQCKPVCSHLARTLDRGYSQLTGSIIRSIVHVQHELHWDFGYDKVPQGLRNKYAFSEILGPRGPVMSEELILGMVLFAPKTTYPTHSHQGITESYVCLSGAISENDVGMYAPGSMILNPPDHPHRITTGDNEPSLLAYAWVGDKEALVEHRMIFRRG